MESKFVIPDAETRARNIASLREACRLLDLWTLELDEAIALADAHLLKQRRARLLYKSNYLPTEQTE
jgi:hypothetical protein